MNEVISSKRALIYWDEHHVMSLLCEPEYLLDEEPWSSWIKQQGGLNTVYTSLRSLPLSEKQRKTLHALLSEPGASLQKYALMLHVSVATYVRYRASLTKTLVTVLNAHLLDKQPVRDEDTKATFIPQNNLPYQQMPLIGREKELETVRKIILRDEVNLLTITGPGGIGKTRLALQVAADLLNNFQHGVFFVSLASLNNPDLVATTIVQTLGLKTVENQPGIDVLKGYLQDKQVLLVLDNFEQVITASPLLVELLGFASGLKILITSQAVLHVYGEYEFNVPPLAVPDLNNLPPLEILAQSPAVALFLNRAQAVKVDFTLTAENASVIGEICFQLDGIPLAIELAAARIKLFAPQALLRELSHRLSLLAQKNSDRSPRHQTLRNAVAWSYQLLGPEERALFAQLGVFVRGCTLNAVDAVCMWGSKSDVPLLEQLASLVDKSMLQHELRPNGEPRFMLLETLREYALERLEADGQTEIARRRHLEYYLGLVESIEPGPKEPNLPAWMKALEEEHDNLRAALHWALEYDEIESALRIAGAIWRFWQIHGHVEEGSKWMKTILDRAKGQMSIARAKALWGAGWLGMVVGTLSQSREYFEEGAIISRKLKDKRYLGLSLHGIGAVARAQGDFEGSRVAFEESLPLFQSLDNTEDVAWTFEHLGVTAIEQGDFVQAVTYLSEGLAVFRELDQRWPCAEALTFLGHAALQQSDYDMARKRYEEALVIYEELEDKLNIATINSYIGATLFGLGDYKKAISLYKENLVLSHKLRDHWGFVWGVERLAEAAEKLKQFERSVCLWSAANALRRVNGVLWHPGFHSYYTEQRFASLKDELGDERWAKLWSEGQAMTPDQVVASALEV
jgi:predicted ATPase